jgi:ABC-type nitrate/sulfonate/bicarbonate transport system substrate-binding protein
MNQMKLFLPWLRPCDYHPPFAGLGTIGHEPGKGGVMAQRRMVALVAGLLLVLAACGGDDGESGADASGGEGCDQIDQMQVGFPGLPADFIQMVFPVSIELGYLRDNCLDVEIVAVESGIAAFRAMAAGEFDLAYGGSVGPILAFGEGAPAAAIASPGALTDFQVVATGDIDSCEEVEGTTVATDGPGGLFHAITEQYLAGCGIDIDQDVELIVGDAETYGPRITQGEIDVTALHIDQRLLIEEDFDVEMNVLGNSWEEMPLFHYATWSTASPLLEDPAKRDQFVRFIAAQLSAGKWLDDEANLEEAIELMAEQSEQPEAVIEESYSTFGPHFPTTCDEMMPPESYDYVIQLQVELGNLSEAYPATDLIDASLCEEAEEMLAENGS